jgi:phosphate transport system protein
MPTSNSPIARELDHLKKKLLHIGKLALSELGKAVEAFSERDIPLAREVAAVDKILDDEEVRLEKECLQVIALHQPVARDLRYVTSVLKINQLIENTGDTAVRIARRAEFLATRPPLPIDVDVSATGVHVVEMFDRALRAFALLDEDAVREVVAMDNFVDNAYRSATARLVEVMETHSDQVETALQTMNLMRHLERAADRATDIANQVLYILTGDISRHTD